MVWGQNWIVSLWERSTFATAREKKNYVAALLFGFIRGRFDYEMHRYGKYFCALYQ